jgi:glyoxylase-like metal-dependent hydrolase (beta-lactamase superfamily II)
MQAAVIDPGGEVDRLIAEMQRLGVTPTALWLTHAHIDHAGGTGEMARRLDLPIVGPHRGDLFWIEQLPEQSRMFRFPAAEPFLPTRWLEDGDAVTLGNTEVAVRHCPGHTPGHVVFHHPGRSAASWATCCSPAPSAGRISRGRLRHPDRQHHPAFVAHGGRDGVHPGARAGEHFRPGTPVQSLFGGT